ncbi:MAG: type 1 glutamine amidotransferase [Nitrospirae bacterium]|nr:MAG: type 1 glutamine amidotransferase [Nitrospirota bacterium]
MHVSTAVCLQHVPFEGPGIFEPLLERYGYRVARRLVPDEGLPIDPGDCLLVMGGPMSVNDPLPWISEELAFIRRAIDRHVPILGVCLGAQLLARALGAVVKPGPTFEVGFLPVIVTEAGRQDPLFAAVQSPLTVFQWHGEGFDPPPDTTILAMSEAYPVQAFRYSDRVYGLVFHVELDEQGIRTLCRECPDDLRRGGLSEETILTVAGSHLPLLHAMAERVVARVAHLP